MPGRFNYCLTWFLQTVCFQGVTLNSCMDDGWNLPQHCLFSQSKKTSEIITHFPKSCTDWPMLVINFQNICNGHFMVISSLWRCLEASTNINHPIFTPKNSSTSLRHTASKSVAMTAGCVSLMPWVLCCAVWVLSPWCWETPETEAEKNQRCKCLESEKVSEVRVWRYGNCLQAKMMLQRNISMEILIVQSHVITYTMRWCFWFPEASPVYTAMLMSKPANEPTQYDEHSRTKK